MTEMAGRDGGPGFDADLIERFNATDEVEIETTRSSGAQPLTTIWIMTDGTDVFVRSVRGPRGAWYRDLVARPVGAIHIGSDRVEVRATAATDPASVALVSDLVQAKYGRRWRASTVAMLQPNTLETTLRLDPA